ncbi:unnamed protein product [Rodentolepis nana]|uniref:Gag-pol polyprotein n=1 Tax=Rodentolepis nana TaxID=102285 RepID=A0A0R3T0X4_RODNA|nr:unnamed protein product [Rodentolepis nana]
MPNILKDLSTCPFVFVRVDSEKRPLQPPYEGPYKVLKRKPKYFILDRNGNKDSVSIDRLKPAYLECPIPNPAGESQRLQILVRVNHNVFRSSSGRGESQCLQILQWNAANHNVFRSPSGMLEGCPRAKRSKSRKSCNPMM